MPIACTAWHTLSEKERSVPSVGGKADGSRTRFLLLAFAPAAASEVCGVVTELEGSGIDKSQLVAECDGTWSANIGVSRLTGERECTTDYR